MGGYKNGKVEIFYGDNPPSNLNILWQKRIVTNDVESSELMQYNNNLATWESLRNKTMQDQIDAMNSLNGTNYVMVYGVGTPTENAEELQAAYDEAKKMPRYIGDINSSGIYQISVYKGQTLHDTATNTYGIVEIDQKNIMVENIIYSDIIDNPEITAKSIRTTVIVAPGIYTFENDRFLLETNYVDLKSLTGECDVIINGLRVSATCNVTGVNTKDNRFSICDSPDNIYTNCKSYAYDTFMDDENGYGVRGTFINCVGGDNAFGSGTPFGEQEEVVVDATFINCKAGVSSFGGNGEISSPFYLTAINCTAGNNSFGYPLIGTLENCKLTSGTFPTPSGEGKIYNCIDGSGNLVNYPVTHTATSKRLILSVTQTGVNAPTYTVIHNDFGPISHAAYIGVGMYRIFFVSNELTNLSKSFIKQNMTLLQSDGGGVSYHIMGNLTANYINLDTLINSSRTDELLDNTIIEVEMITI